jgi:hypothetical protein
VSAFSELLDVVEHLVATHTTWNQTLSKDEAVAKVLAAKTLHTLEHTAPVLEDGAVVVHDITSLPVKAGPTMADVDKLLADAEELRKQVTGE